MFPKKYVPNKLNKDDRKTQIKALQKSKTDYKNGVFTTRPKLKSYKSKVSKHVLKARKVYNINTISPSRALSIKTGCKVNSLRQIQSKGMGAYYSGGSRPGQTAFSWGRARLASAITGGKSAAVDYKILEAGCKVNSKALTLAKQAKAKHKYGQRKVPKI